MESNITVGDIQTSGVDLGYFVVRVSFDHPEEGLLVGERIAQELVKHLPGVSNVQDLDYFLFEEFNSRNGLPGFAIFGKKPDSSSPDKIKKIAIVRSQSPDLDDRIDTPERFMIGEQPKPISFEYHIEAPNSSPLSTLVKGKGEYRGLDSLLKKIF